MSETCTCEYVSVGVEAHLAAFEQRQPDPDCTIHPMPDWAKPSEESL